MVLWIIPVSKGGREQEVRMATYGPGIDQSQHAKSVSHIIINMIEYLVYKTMPAFVLFWFFLLSI